MKKGAVSPMIAGVIIVAVVIAGIAFTMKNSGKPQSQALESTTEPSAEVAGMENAAVTIEVEAGSFYYKPNEIRVKKGETVKITLNSVSMMHDFVIDELNVKMPIVKNGETGTVEFVADKPGTYEYYCSVGQHRAQGQVGTLIVEE